MSRKIDWRKLVPGDGLIYFWEDWDGKGSFPVQVTDVFRDHAIATGQGQMLWIDDDTAVLFKRK